MRFSDYFDSVEWDAGNGSLSENLFVPAEIDDLDGAKAAILVVPEYRYSSSVGLCQMNEVLASLSSLHLGDYSGKIAVLGSLRLGETITDTEAAIKLVISELLQKRVLPIVFGGDREITYSVYAAFKAYEQIVNIASVDYKLNVGTEDEQGYIGRIVNEQPNFLFNYSNLGFQTYHVSHSELELADELYFDAIRLGAIRGDIYKTEPIIRSSEILSFSMDSIKSSDFKSAVNPQPNGLYAEEACQIIRYAGLSEKLKTIVITEFSSFAQSSDSLLLAEMLWCLFDGLKSRFSEIPNARNEQFLKYRVSIKDDEFDLVFYKSLKTDRWWMEVPVPPQYANKYKKHHLIPCDYNDYKVATSDDLPNRWWRAYKKLL